VEAVFVDQIYAVLNATSHFRTGRLLYVADQDSGTAGATDVDNQPTDNYAYDGNGGVSQDKGNGISFIIYGPDNLPHTMFRSGGSVVSYWYDLSGGRVRKSEGTATTYYIRDALTNPFVVIHAATPNQPIYYVDGRGTIGHVSRNDSLLTRFSYLRDHLGSVRATIQSEIVTDDFSGNLSKWTVTQGSGFQIESGVLSASAGSINYLVNSSTRTLDDGYIKSDVMAVTSAAAGVTLALRYQDPLNLYFVRAYTNTIAVFERINGSTYTRAVATLAESIHVNTWYRLKIGLNGGKISVYWNGSATPILEWTDSTPWLSGKVGFAQFSGQHIHWDNYAAWTTGAGQIASSDDYDPWGMVLEGRSTNQGVTDARFKFTGKERDAESLYDYFGARYYDARIGRWLAVDPIANASPEISAYAYAHNNPLSFLDPNGMRDTVIDGRKFYNVMPDVVTTANRTHFGTVAIIGSVGTLVLESPDPYDRITGAVILAGVAIYQTWQSLRNKPLEAEESQSENAANTGHGAGKRKYSGHAKKQMEDQKVSEERVEEAIAKGKTEPGNDPGTVEHWLPGRLSDSGRGARVVTNSSGDVITVTDKGTDWKGGRLYK
jgi:RHS repeat-associated protein